MTPEVKCKDPAKGKYTPMGNVRQTMTMAHFDGSERGKGTGMEYELIVICWVAKNDLAGNEL